MHKKACHNGNNGNDVGMRTPQIPIKKHGSGWILDIPASLTASGKRYRPKFETRRQAEIERANVLQRGRVYGQQSYDLDARQRSIAFRAFEILKAGGHDPEALVQAVTNYVDKEDQRGHSVHFNELWREYTERRSDVSAYYSKDIQRVGGRLGSLIQNILVCDIDASDLERYMDKAFPTPVQFNKAYRTLSPAFVYACKAGYCRENPLARIDKRKVLNGRPNCLTYAQSWEVLKACRDYRNAKDMPEAYRLDCRDCLPAIALMLFAGIRPAEITRLEWEDVHLDEGEVRVGEEVAKTRQTRFVRMNDNLIAWLALVSLEKRKGHITPTNWGKKIKAIRYSAGISEKRDVLRHTFASYHLAMNNDVNATRSAMGHSSNDILFRHYRHLVKRADAVRFWGIFPEGSQRTFQVVQEKKRLIS